MDIMGTNIKFSLDVKKSRLKYQWMHSCGSLFVKGVYIEKDMSRCNVLLSFQILRKTWGIIHL